MIGLHEADASYQVNPLRGAQFYPNCVQIEVVGNGTVELPSGVSFPGAYKYSDPGVVYDVSWGTRDIAIIARDQGCLYGTCLIGLLLYEDYHHGSVYHDVPDSRYG